MDRKMARNVQTITCFTKLSLAQHAFVWKTKLVLNTVENTLNADDINFNSGIFQGDFLSPILFCVTLVPLNKLLNNT